ncbi:facilitated trehalose transporter Tret1-2 homolog [Aricia agestis]|uniref:facilitated trehalose transporter Tret1-2 homolog n=1 Tax=Aricia agestis TaxID=91739 RepID=UPI001C209A85|nr:facilitated trehalose transporter Tret1-2 homolog [Aricia agestis]
MGIIQQILGTVLISYLGVTMGIMYTWPSSTFLLFASPNTTLNRPMTSTELSLLGSLSSIATLIITPFTSSVIDYLGRKKSFLLLGVNQVLTWTILASCDRVEAVLASMFISGCSGCMMLVIPMYISEICKESIRGSMTSAAVISLGIGMMLSYIFGGYLEYHVMNYTCLSLSVLGVVLLMMVKESPLFLLQKGFEKEALRSLAFYRGEKITSKEVIEELETIKRTLNVALDEQTPEEEKLKADLDKPREKLSRWAFLKKSKSSRRALLVVIMLYTAAIFQGLVVVQVFAEPLFTEATPTISATLSSVLMALLSTLAGFVGAYLIERYGRRHLMIYASSATGACCVVLGVQIQVGFGPSWLTTVLLYVYCVSYTLGAGVVPYVINAEVFLPEIKSFASMICMEWAFLCNFVVLFIFNPLVTAVGLGIIFYMFAAFCFLSSVFCWFFLPETKGLAVDVIQQSFVNKCYK